MSTAQTTRISEGSASTISATPPATPAMTRSSRDRYRRSATAALRIQGEGTGVGRDIELDLHRCAVEARRRPGVAVVEQAVTIKVVARERIVSGRDPQRDSG